ncbi:hypothetical protein GCM10027286_21430 [Virgibacillus ainsalahensis]
MKKLYDELKDEDIKQKVWDLIEMEEDAKYRKKYFVCMERNDICFRFSLAVKPTSRLRVCRHHFIMKTANLSRRLYSKKDLGLRLLVPPKRPGTAITRPTRYIVKGFELNFFAPNFQVLKKDRVTLSIFY